MPNHAHLSRPPRILIASDRNAELRALESFLTDHGHVVLRLYAAAPVLERAQAMRPDVIILDAKLADRPSLDVSRLLRDDPVVGVSTPILLLTDGQPGAKEHLAALRAGIWGLLSQPVNANELLLIVDTLVLLRLDADRAPRETLRDAVTGLYSAHGLVTRARELIFQASQHNMSAACVAFAAELGAEADAAAEGPVPGEVVERVAQVFKAMGRRSDAIGRVGPAEFAVVAPGTDASGAVKLAERFRSAMPKGGGAEPRAAGAFEFRAGYDAVSNVRYKPIEPTDLLARAARALRMAKAEGAWIRQSV